MKSFTNKFAVQAWANMASVRAYSFDFINYEKSFADTEKYFTPKAWSLFHKALKDNGTLATVINRKMVISAVATGAVTVEDKGVINGRYTWEAILPLKVTLASGTSELNTQLNVTLTIVRTNQDNNIQGLAIDSFRATKLPQMNKKPTAAAKKAASLQQ